ncbi:Piwi-like protein 2 [Acropora cervicornis]|uniref:Piwi-like protein 2 n=1 Tax=Acropora cervicornis TaxID=6130 RepID=A0AAD9QRZ1_ACRCE|nr:Piwi-like protein 2 [Acropora cervicornis]
MAGRGGRGAALLQALEKPARPPGQAGQNGQNVQPSQQQGPPQPGPDQHGQRQPYPQQYPDQHGRGQPYPQPYPAQPYHQRPMHPAHPYQQTRSDVRPRWGNVWPSPRVPKWLHMAEGLLMDEVPSSLYNQADSLCLRLKNDALHLLKLNNRVLSQTGEKGTAGKPTSLSCNFIPIRFVEQKVYQYHVSFSPEIDSRKERCRLLSAHRDLLGSARAFDGSILFLPKQLEGPATVLESERKTDGSKVTVTVTLTRISYETPPAETGGMMLLCDVSHRLLRTETVYDFIYELYHRKRDRFEEETKKQLVGNIVLTRYNNKTYRIDDVAFDQNPKCTFTFHTGEQMSYLDYYRNVYNKEIQDPEQPLLVHRPKDKEVQRDIAAHTRVSPMQRQQAMMKFIDNINSSPEALSELSSWGIQLDQGMLRTEGRQLPLEKIFLGSTSFQSSPQADWGQQAVKEQVITPVPLHKWVVFFVNRDKSKALDFINMMRKVTPSMGIQVNEPLIIDLPNDRTETFLRSIRENLTPQVQMVVVIFPTSRDDRYSAVINAKTISQQNKLRSVTQKIALQINCKLGGELWALDIPLKSLMVIGIDVYHDASRGGRSVGGFVASMNKSLTRWYSRVCFQSPGQELIDGLKMALTASLKKYHEVNQTLPDRIVVYRDGVGDGQLRTVAGYEVQQLSECFALFGERYSPKMAVGQGPIPKLDNPGPGAVLDHTITRRDWYDFYLVSQHVRQGTVTPTHYIVVHDKSELKPDYMQRLSYKLTHLYYNWPGTVRVPAPCQSIPKPSTNEFVLTILFALQYAHKLAYLVGQNIHNEPSHDLSDRLFFL